MARAALIAGNWKMNGLAASLSEIEAVASGLSARPNAPEALICPPATLLERAVASAQGTGLAIGGQDCHADASGAHTGDVSAEMLRDAGATAVIAGHSERRAAYAESDAAVRAKIAGAWRAGLTAVLCVGETLEQRESGMASEVVAAQLDASLPASVDPARLEIAYEPVWAIGTGKSAASADIANMHAHLRSCLRARADGKDAASVRLLYGGSVKPATVAEIVSLGDVDGALVGGASLKATDFLAMLDAVAALGHA
ncbi:MAG: triose-phosphate isomerase [Pseudomonadota bacterium]